MPNDFYNNIANVAERLLKDYGREIVIRAHPTPKWYPGAPAPDPGVNPVDIIATGVFRDHIKTLKNGEEIVRKNATFLFSAKDIPDAFDFTATGTLIIDGDIEYKVLTIEITKPGSVPLYYEVEVAKRG